MRERERRLGFFILGLYTLSFIAVLAPYYNHAYRLVVGFAYATLFFASLCLIVCAIPCYAHRRRFRDVFLVAILGLLVFFTGSQVHDWRYRITDKYIKGNHCDMDEPTDDKPILGGIQEIRVEGVEKTGAFENLSHCLFVVCEEEFFYCDNPAVVIGP